MGGAAIVSIFTQPTQQYHPGLQLLYQSSWKQLTQLRPIFSNKQAVFSMFAQPKCHNKSSIKIATSYHYPMYNILHIVYCISWESVPWAIPIEYSKYFIGSRQTAKMKIEICFAYFAWFACIMVGIVLTHLIFTQNGRNVSKPPDRWPVAEAVAREGRMGGYRPRASAAAAANKN